MLTFNTVPNICVVLSTILEAAVILLLNSIKLNYSKKLIKNSLSCSSPNRFLHESLH